MVTSVREVPLARLGTRRGPPPQGAIFVAAGVTLTFFSVLTGALDVAIPALTGRPRFSALLTMAETVGPWYLFLHIWLHNLGLAFVVPGVGLLAYAFEKDERNRRWVAWILAAAVVGSLLAGIELVIRRGYWRQEVVFGLLLLESAAVLLLTWAGVRALRRYVPTPKARWAWLQPTRRLAPYAAISAVALAFGAFVETLYLSRILGL